MLLSEMSYNSATGGWDLERWFRQNFFDLDRFCSDGVIQKAEQAIASIDDLEAAIEAYHFPDSEPLLCGGFALIFGALYLRRSTWFTSWRPIDVFSFRFPRLLSPFGGKLAFTPRRLETGVLVALPDWFLVYRVNLDVCKNFWYDFFQNPFRALRAGTPHGTNPGGIMVFSTIVFAVWIGCEVFLCTVFSPAQLFYLLGCGFSAYTRAVCLQNHEVSERKKYAQVEKKWLPRMATDNPHLQLRRRSSHYY
ncbi:hypothetical protein OHC33_002817 [Knufia fluminis]|uniref:Uncharacterized protein n=1 Tax=Knufia fluminis TaxID=191047 RepID=A0AAN8IQN1_9EURO|nr:hypothetical protein OHC33_002817 [Knufia fluminis]